MAYILIVDDDPDFSAAIAAVLTAAGHETAVEDDPQSALASVQRRTPDLLVLDVMFPENPVAGFEFARTVRRQSRGMPILMLTAVNAQFPLGFSTRDIDPKWLPIADFLEKPVDFHVLCDRVQQLLTPPTAGR